MSDDDEPEAVDLRRGGERKLVDIRFGYWEDRGDGSGRLKNVPDAYAVQVTTFAHPANEVKAIGCGPELAAARKRFDEVVAALRADGWGDPPPKVPAPPRVKPAPSKPRAPAATSAWMKSPPAPLTKQLASLESAAKKHELGHRFGEIAALARPAIDLAMRKAKPADLKKIGGSRLGGHPDLPAGFAWPAPGGVALTFVAQIALDDVKELDLEGALPKGGLLSLFAQLDSEEPEYGERCAIAHVPASAKLVRTPSPPEVARPIETAGVFTPKLRLTIPPSEGAPIEGLGLNEDEHAAYHDELFLGSIPEGRVHRLLGWPTAATHHGSRGKRSLLQIDSDHHIGLEMGDVEQLRVYVDAGAIDAAALAAAVCTLSEA